MTVDNPKIFRNQLSKEKEPGCVGCIEDEILPFVIGFLFFIIGIPPLNSQHSMERTPAFFVGVE